MRGEPNDVRGRRTLTITLLFTANAIILVVLGAALALAGWGRHGEPYWRTWVQANAVLAASLLFLIFDRHLPPALVGTLPNGLLVLGFALRWRAAREFGGRTVPDWMIWMPPAVLVATVLPFIGTSYAPAFTSANLALGLLAAATAWEFWRDRADGLPSRYGLVAAYGVMAASFGFRIGQGLLTGDTMPMHLPHDDALAVHLMLAVLHTSASGAFSLSLAYERTNAGLAHAADHDSLTGLLNRRAFEARLHARLDRNDANFAIALIDIDHFKQVNDMHGHAAGDEALRKCAAICRRMVFDQGAVARIGGEEFVILLDDTDWLTAQALLECIRHAIAGATISSPAGEFAITISGGICHGTDVPTDFDAMMRLVDEGLYRAKHNGRDRIETIAA